MKKAFLALASAVALAGCGSGLTKEQVIELGGIAYSDIVSFIVVGYQSHWEEVSPEEMGLSPVYAYSSPYAGFAQKDIDGDGFDELLIGDRFEDGSYALYDIYCFGKKDASLIHLAKGGERDRFTVTGGGVIVENGSNSAEDSFTRAYRIEAERLAEVSEWEDDLMDLDFTFFSDIAAPERLCGGYTEQREPTEEEVAMFRDVTGTGDMVLTPLSVSTQVVAGTNYKFWCRYQEGEAGGHCWVVIFKPLPGQGDPSLTSIDKQ